MLALTGKPVVLLTYSNLLCQSLAATDPTSAALRMSPHVMATRARRELHLGYEGDAEPPLPAQVNRRVLQRGEDERLRDVRPAVIN